jgi:hypothetical protein
VVGGMYRARGALFKTMEIVVDEKPLALATSRIVAAERFNPVGFQLVLPKCMLVYRRMADYRGRNAPGQDWTSTKPQPGNVGRPT